MTPYLPPDGIRELEDLAFDLSTAASQFSSKLHPIVREGIGDLIRSMNCYYSNLIEGHDTHPIDIERALKNDYSSEPRKRNLQLEARAHIATQKLLDVAEISGNPYSLATLKRIHKEFLSRLPEELLIVRNPNTREERRVEPGIIRDDLVQVGEHIPPPSNELSSFLERFEEEYALSVRSKIGRIIAIPCAHHRLLWIHPFFDGNGRVARLADHASFRALEIGNSLWTPSRGLARNVSEYKQLLTNADQQRRGDTDGRGNLSLSALVRFCTFYLEQCLDQVKFMHTMLDPSLLLGRIERYAQEREDSKELPAGSFLLLQHALLHGEYERGAAPRITGYKERQARSVLSALLKNDLLVSTTPKGPVKLGFPMKAVEYWFPRLFAVG